MAVSRAKIPQLTLPKSASDWEQLGFQALAVLKQVPLKYWQLAVQALLVLSIAVSLARLFWLIVPAPAIPPAAVAIPVISQQAGASGSSGIDINQIKSLTVFGKAAPVATKDAPVNEKQAVDTRLNLVLLGVMASSDENSGKAIISSGDKQDVYTVGQTIPVGNGVTLAKVFSDRVIINNNGQAESLWLYTNDPNAKVASQNFAPPPPPSPARNWTQNLPNGHSPDSMSPVQPTSGGAGPDGALQEVIKTLSDVIAYSPVREGGKVVGLRIRPAKDADKFRSLGLQTDDLVLSINGVPMNNPVTMMEMFKNTGNSTSYSLEIKRGGTVMSIDVAL